MERSGELQSHGVRKVDAEAAPEETTPLDKRQESQPYNSPAATQHLPTPSSLGHVEDKNEGDQIISENPEDIASGGHFDEDERDLLSLYGDTGPMCDVQADPLGGDTASDLDDAREIPETPINLTPVSYTHLTLPTKRIV